jgi:hypothetical protein
MYSGQRFHVRLSSAKGTFLERWSGTAREYDSPREVALRIAGQRSSGTIVEVTVDSGVFRYRVGRMAGLPSVTRIMKSDLPKGAS